MVSRRNLLRLGGATVGGGLGALFLSDTINDEFERQVDIGTDHLIKGEEYEIQRAGEEAFEVWKEQEHEDLGRKWFESDTIALLEGNFRSEDAKYGHGTYFYADSEGNELLDQLDSDNMEGYRQAWIDGFSSMLNEQSEFMLKRAAGRDELVENSIILRDGEEAVAKTVTREDLIEYAQDYWGTEKVTHGDYTQMLFSMKREDVDNLYEQNDWEYLNDKITDGGHNVESFI